ncbi:thioesterase family protein [Rhodococcus sp. NPDC127530]|uniref:thioesterase family protein n=1 Tax=unclassified Rhodococcus (in: high G+C Gram-positive bacteria) TaxID=192944 RepID=UPI003632D26C
MSDEHAFFTATGLEFLPLPTARGGWSADMITGPAVTGLTARALETAHSAAGFHPARLTVDLCRPVRNRPLTVVTTSVREGNRIRVADAELLQDGETVARGSVVLLKRSCPPPGTVWQRPGLPGSPPPHLVDDLSVPPGSAWFGSDDHPAGWSTDRTEHQGPSRKRMWQRPSNIVAGEELTPFIRAAIVGDATNLMTNWGTAGVGYINADLTLALARLPDGAEIGLESDNHLSADGISVGTATMFDRHGPVGTCTVSALANEGRQIDFASQRPKCTRASRKEHPKPGTSVYADPDGPRSLSAN